MIKSFTVFIATLIIGTANVMAFATIARAETNTTTTQSNVTTQAEVKPVISNREKKGQGPCKKIIEACTAAGFVKGGHKPKKGENKGLWKDCVQQIVSGQTVTGVSVEPSVIEACKIKRASRGK